MTSAFSRSLSDTAAVFAPFAKPPQPPGSKTWNGKAYVIAESESRFDPYAAMWWVRLTTIADLLERQVEPLSSDQRLYLERCLFGGMGSLNDVCLDDRNANRELERRRADLYREFVRM
jgi:hypothetical protein